MSRTITTTRATAGELEHLVQLYETEDFLCEVVADFLAEGFERGEPMIVIASAPRRAAFAQRLAARDRDVDAAVRAGRLVMLDARQTLDQLLLDGGPVWERFQRIIGAPVTALSKRFGGAPVRAYGEMVDLLWRDGSTAEAVRLEEMWSLLHGQGGLTLLCAYVIGGFYKQSDLASVCGKHGRVLPPETKLQSEPIRSEHALREALETNAFTHESQFARITDALPVLVAYIDADERYRFANQAYARWFETEREAVIGKHVAEVLGAAAYEHIKPRVKAALAGQALTFRTLIPYATGPRTVEATYMPDVAADGEVHGFVALVADVSRHARLEAQREAATRRAERLVAITSAVAQAITTDQVIEALIERVADAVGAATAGVWYVEADGPRLRRSRGYNAAVHQALATMPAHEGVLPAIDVARTGVPIWFDSQMQLLERYPHLAPYVTPGDTYAIACLPITSQSRMIGALGLTFTQEVPLDDEHRAFLSLVVDYCGQALDRVRLFEAERASRLAAEAARANMEHLHHLAARVIAARDANDVFDAALDTISSVLGTPRAAVLLDDADGVMRFAASRGLSEAYRHAIESHTPWDRADTAPRPILIRDVREDVSLAGYLPLFERERIAALGFFPLVDAGTIVGKFIVYYEQPHELSAVERDIATAIVNHVAAGVSRFSAMERERATARQVLRAASRLTELQEATSRLASALTMSDVADVVLSVSASTLGAGIGAVYLTDPDGELRLAGSRGAEGSLSPTVLSEAARTRHAVWIESYEQLLQISPRARDEDPTHLQAVAGLPLVHAGELLGGFALGFSDRERLDAGSRQWLLSFASQVALAVERARAYEAESRARTLAETMYRVADSLSSTQLDLDASGIDATDRGAMRVVLQRCCDLLVEHSDIALARIWTVGFSGELELQAASELPDGRRVAVDDLHRLATEIAEEKQPHLTRELAVYPLTVEDKLVGVMALRAQFPSVTDTLEMLGSSARTIAIGIERLRIHADRERLVGELERTVRFNETFAGMLGHDLRNPLGSMMTGAQLVMLRTSDEKVTGPLTRVLSAGDRMTRMIDQLLDFTRARVGGGLALQPKAMDMRGLVDQAIEEVAVAHPGWRFDVVVTGDVCGMWDADRLTQVFSNLLGNAVQHGVQQFPIRIAIAGDAPDTIVIELWNGGMIPLELLPILFEPFRGSRHKRNGSKGLGLGLFITQQIIRAHGGEISATSAVDTGTTFRIQLPRRSA